MASKTTKVKNANLSSRRHRPEMGLSPAMRKKIKSIATRRLAKS